MKRHYLSHASGYDGTPLNPGSLQNGGMDLCLMWFLSKPETLPGGALLIWPSIIQKSLL